LQTGGILLYVEDLKRGTNKEVGPKGIFEMGSKFVSTIFNREIFRLIDLFCAVMFHKKLPCGSQAVHFGK